MSTDLKEKKTETAGEINARDAYPYRFLGAIRICGSFPARICPCSRLSSVTSL